MVPYGWSKENNVYCLQVENIKDKKEEKEVYEYVKKEGWELIGTIFLPDKKVNFLFSKMYKEERVYKKWYNQFCVQFGIVKKRGRKKKEVVEKKRIKEKQKRKPKQCKICKEYGHIAKTCTKNKEI